MNMNTMIWRGHAPLAHPCPQLVEPVIEGFKRLLALPQGEQELWCFDVLGDGDPDVGLVQASQKSVGTKEDKWYFHYPGYEILHYLLRAKRVVLQPWQYGFLHALQEMKDVLDAEGLAFCVRLDEALPGYAFADAFRRHCGSHVIRLLCYQGQRKGYVATNHVDRDFRSLALWASEDGLEIDGDLVTTNAQTAYQFFGVQAQEMTGGWKGALKAVYHGARATDGWIKSRVRYACVYFSHCAPVPTEALMAEYKKRRP